MERANHCSTSIVGGLCLLALATNPPAAFADEGGVSFYLPGSFGSLAATPAVPGWSWATIYLHSDVAAGAGSSFRVAVGSTLASAARPI